MIAMMCDVGRGVVDNLNDIAVVVETNAINCPCMEDSGHH